ncbi:restriction endonuclease type II-like protein [Polychytrium aggregatum]|uniref:restriction endonuclease type II-like protein n=1 Tax=Polychytrium aggregatum TaxID=110093 RepID=UPI0022FE8DC9|nr:restriction endonuclease type II-like protein [Polychytrium aggregatum]KAI9203119.1 restriction endonuclease type II-like protein [Polychytrium aggregatum]
MSDPAPGNTGFKSSLFRIPSLEEVEARQQSAAPTLFFKTSASRSSDSLGGSTSASTSISAAGLDQPVAARVAPKGNRVLEYVQNARWEFGNIVADYQVGRTSCVLFISLRYHRLHPEYLYGRIKLIGSNYISRIVLCLVDIEDHQQAIRELTSTTIMNNFAMILAWSNEEAGKYLETLKMHENQPADSIKERVDETYLSKATNFLTQIKTVNKTDVVTLSSTFGSVKSIMNATEEELSLLPGFGERKVRRIYEAFREPFIASKKPRRTK